MSKYKTIIIDPKECIECGEIDSITYQDENNNIIYPKCINCGFEPKRILISTYRSKKNDNS